jgi:transcriptional regulator with XRE-family HTH domain
MNVELLRIERGKELRKLRKLKGITQEKIAKLCGISLPTIGRMEKGKKNWGIDCELLFLAVLKEIPDKAPKSKTV